MTRILPMCLAMLATSTASAQLVPVSLEVFTAVSDSPTPPTTIGWIIVERDSFGGAILQSIRLSIPDVVPTDEGMTWTINAANAASFGFDFARVDELLDNPVLRYHSVCWTAEGCFSDQSLLREINGETQFVEPTMPLMNLDRIELTLDVYRHSAVANLRSFMLSARVIGEAILIPEPSSAMLLLGCVGLYWCRRHSGGYR